MKYGMDESTLDTSLQPRATPVAPAIDFVQCFCQEARLFTSCQMAPVD